MLYQDLAEVYEKLEATTKNLEKRDILAEFFTQADSDILPSVALLVQGRIFPAWSEEEVGIASKLMLKIISKVYGVSELEVMKKVKETGDYGLAAEHFTAHKRQQTLMSTTLKIDFVHERLKTISGISGAGTVDKKTAAVSELLSSAKPLEARYITRTVLATLRIGVGEGTVRDAICKAFDLEKEDVQKAYDMLNDYGEVARLAKTEGAKALRKAQIKVGRPIKVMLAQKAKSIPDALERLGKAAFEYKYDGMRCQIHGSNGEIKIFTRRLDEVTKQFPDIAKLVEKGITAKDFIIEGETIAVDNKGNGLPFQKLSRRIKRKYDIEMVIKEIPAHLNLFDLNYLDGKSYLEKPFKDRRKALEKIFKPTKGLNLAKQIVTDSPKKVEKFYAEALEHKQEGLMAKNLEAGYKPGSRVGYMLKIKPTMETLDLVIVGAEWGEGKRANWLSSFLLACRDGSEYKTIGKMGTGLSDEQFTQMTKTLKPLILKEKGKGVEVKPKIVIEVAYEEIQKSPTYESGYALRFPRMIQVREDKGPKDSSELDFVEQLYGGQR